MQDKIIKLLEEQNQKLDILIANTTVSVEREAEIWTQLTKIINAALISCDT